MNAYLKAWTVVLSGLLITGITTYNAVTGAGFNAITILIIALAVLKVGFVYATTNVGNLGLDSKAKAAVAGVITFLIGLATVIEPAVTSQKYDSASLLIAAVAVLGFLGVYAAPNTPAELGNHAVNVDIALPDKGTMG